ncbi:hypothetical protein GEMRC1_006173 [Eukaryota sp. GEM-RC1]
MSSSSDFYLKTLSESFQSGYLSSDEEDSYTSTRLRRNSSARSDNRRSRRPSIVLDKVYYRNDIIPVDENHLNEFKAIQVSRSPVSMMVKLTIEYINAFLNSGHGTIYFGIDDDGVILGVPKLDRSQRDELRLKCDGGLNRFIPQVDPKLYKIDFVPVICRDEQQLPDLFVVEVSVSKGTAPIYFTQRYSAFIRTTAGVTRASQSLIEERLGFENKTNRLSSRVYSNVFNSQVDLIGRQSEVNHLKDFLTMPGNRIAMVYGSPLVGKSSLAREVMSELIKFDAYLDSYTSSCSGVQSKDQSPPPCHLVLDLSGVYDRHVLPKDAMRLALKSHSNRNDGEFNSRDIRGSDLKVKYQSLFAGREVFILFENAGNISNLLDLLPSPHLCTSSKVIVTSRKNLSFEHVVDLSTYTVLSLRVQPLVPSEGALLLKSLVPSIRHSEGEKLSELVSGLPVALKMLGSLMTRRKVLTAEILSNRLSNPPTSPSDVGEPLASLFHLLSPALSQLPPECRVILEVSSVFYRSFTIESLRRSHGTFGRDWWGRGGFSTAEAFVGSVKSLIERENLFIDGLSLLIEDSLLNFEQNSQRYCLLESIKTCFWHLLGTETRDLLRRAFVEYFLNMFQKKFNKKSSNVHDSKSFGDLHSLCYSESSNFEALLLILKETPHLEGRDIFILGRNIFEDILSENAVRILHEITGPSSPSISSS